MERKVKLNQSVKALSRTATLARYSAVVSIVNLGISILKFIIDYINDPNVASKGLIPVLISSLLTVFLALSLLKFSSFIKNGIAYREDTAMQRGFLHLKNYFMIIGGLFWVITGIIVLGFLIALLTKMIS